MDDVDIDLPNNDIQVLLPPGYPSHMDGSTLVVYGYSGAPMVHSWPVYAGVERISELGIGSAAGYDPGDSFTLPINADLGDKSLKSYEFLIIIDHPGRIQLNQVSGNNPNLDQSYPTQYDPAKGFTSPPTVLHGSTDGYIYLSQAGSSQTTGRVNLARLKFRIIGGLPMDGIHIAFQVVELLDGSGNDVCAQFSSGCHPKNGVIARNFRIRQD